MQALIATSGGDLRRSITYLQTASRLANAAAITPRDIQEIAGVVPDVVIDDFARTIGVDPRYGKNSGDDTMQLDAAVTAPTFTAVRKKVAELMREGYSGTQLLSQVKPDPSSHRLHPAYNLAAPRRAHREQQHQLEAKVQMRACIRRCGQGTVRRCGRGTVDPRGRTAVQQSRRRQLTCTTPSAPLFLVPVFVRC